MRGPSRWPLFSRRAFMDQTESPLQVRAALLCIQCLPPPSPQKSTLTTTDLSRRRPIRGVVIGFCVASQGGARTDKTNIAAWFPMAVKFELDELRTQRGVS